MRLPIQHRVDDGGHRHHRLGLRRAPNQLGLLRRNHPAHDPCPAVSARMESNRKTGSGDACRRRNLMRKRLENAAILVRLVLAHPSGLCLAAHTSLSCKSRLWCMVTLIVGTDTFGRVKSVGGTPIILHLVVARAQDGKRARCGGSGTRYRRIARSSRAPRSDGHLMREWEKRRRVGDEVPRSQRPVVAVNHRTAASTTVSFPSARSFALHRTSTSGSSPLRSIGRSRKPL